MSGGRSGGDGRDDRMPNGHSHQPGEAVTALAALEDRLRALERELDTADGEGAGTHPPASTPRRHPPVLPAQPPHPYSTSAATLPRHDARGAPVPSRPPPERPPPPDSRPPRPQPQEGVEQVVGQARERMSELRSQVDELLRFRDRLRSVTEELIDDYHRALDGEPAQAIWQEGRVLLDVGPFGEIATLAAFERALREIPELEDVYVHSFERGRAQIELTLSRPIPLLEPMRSALPFGFWVTDAATDRISLELEGSAFDARRPWRSR